MILNNLEFIPTYNDDVKKDERFYLYTGRHEKKEKHIKVYLTFTEQEYKIIQKIREKKRISNLLNELIDKHIFEKEEGKWIWICPQCYTVGKVRAKNRKFENAKNHMRSKHGNSKLKFYVMNILKNSFDNNITVLEQTDKNKWDRWIWICPQCYAVSRKTSRYDDAKYSAKEHMRSKHGKRDLTFYMQKINITNGIKVCQENCKNCVFGGCRGAKCRNQNADVIFQIDGWRCQSMKKKTGEELQPMTELRPIEILEK